MRIRIGFAVLLVFFWGGLLYLMASSASSKRPKRTKWSDEPQGSPDRATFSSVSVDSTGKAVASDSPKLSLIAFFNLYLKDEEVEKATGVRDVPVLDAFDLNRDDWPWYLGVARLCRTHNDWQTRTQHV